MRLKQIAEPRIAPVTVKILERPSDWLASEHGISGASKPCFMSIPTNPHIAAVSIRFVTGQHWYVCFDCLDILRKTLRAVSS
jgi:hypothetical protein